MTSDLVFVDVETTGLDASRHEVVEVAYAIGDLPVVTLIPPHTLTSADAIALTVNRYYERNLDDRTRWCRSGDLHQLMLALTNRTLVGANIGAFDVPFLSKLLGVTPWHYHLVDVEQRFSVFAQDGQVHSLQASVNEAAQLLQVEHPPMSYHSAAGDVRAARWLHAATETLIRRMSAVPEIITTERN